MCSIFGVLDIKSDPLRLREQAIEMSKNCATVDQIGLGYIHPTRQF